MDAHTVSAPAATTTGDASDAPLSLTELAATQAQQAMEREGAHQAALRVSVVGGGCSGFQYNLGFDREIHDDDTVTEQHGVRIVVDAASLPYLRGLTIDYVTGLHGAGFKFLNPNASRTCGCGSSFAA
jgi:iron-sulfur cluster assembly accessory protein